MRKPALRIAGLVSIAAIVAALLAEPGAPTRATPGADFPVGFLDQARGTYILIQLGEGHDDHGRFEAAIDEGG